MFLKKRIKIFFFKQNINCFVIKRFVNFLCLNNIISKFFSILRFFTRRMYLKGYNYRLKFLKKRRYIRLYLGAPLSWVVPFPFSVRIKRIRKKFFKFIGNNWNILLRFCFYLKNLQDHLPYKRRGFLLTRFKVKRKVGKRSRR